MAALVPLVLGGLLAPSLSARPTDEMAMRLRQNVVLIFAGTAAASRTGFGFIVGQRQEMLYLVTAWHVVYGDRNDPDKSPKIKVAFFSDQGEKHDAEILGKNDHVHDLAVLRVHAPPDFHWTRQCLAGPDEEKYGTAVRFVGRNTEWFVPPLPGAIASEVPSTESKLEVDGLHLQPGSSGGPLVAGTGIVGMIQNDAPDNGLALTIGFIRDALRGWDYPWDLENSPPGQAPPAAHKTQVGTTPATGTIQVVYNGDAYGCVLNLSVQVGQKRFIPTFNPFTVPNVPLGNTKYQIAGTITCPVGTPPAGVCVARGFGPIDIEDGARYYFTWKSYTYAKCAITLTKY